jgi:hypothetical protein
VATCGFVSDINCIVFTYCVDDEQGALLRPIRKLVPSLGQELNRIAVPLTKLPI